MFDEFHKITRKHFITTLGPEKSLEYYLSTPHWLDAFMPPLEKHTRYLAQTIRRILDGDMAPPSPEPVRPIPLPPVSSSKPQKWQIAASAIIVALGAYYFLGSFPENLTGEPELSVAENLAAESAAGVSEDLPEEPAPGLAENFPEEAEPSLVEIPAVEPEPSFVRKWDAVEISPNIDNMMQMIAGNAIREILLSALQGPNKSAEFEVNEAGQYTYRLTRSASLP